MRGGSRKKRGLKKLPVIFYVPFFCGELSRGPKCAFEIVPLKWLEQCSKTALHGRGRRVQLKRRKAFLFPLPWAQHPSSIHLSKSGDAIGKEEEEEEERW